ncbi:hypothetical protein FQA39_LY09623 [Lamprigera yunnana]|nr:hypothetical protein FQA39_LY09623 [Lamprigera yunnana]
MNLIKLLWLISIYRTACGDSSPSIDLKTEGSNNIKTKSKSDDNVKTLAQQVSEGRYGLIPTEIFGKPIIRPGIISYETNSDVPKDTIKNLGGLNESDIWLAENHLLVVKGGVFSLIENGQEDVRSAWPPIDDFVAPKRPVKIPKNPKVPPPFPVQFKDDGPLQILGTNFTRTLNESFLSPPYPLSPFEGYNPANEPFFPAPHQHPPNTTAGKTTFPDSPYFTPIQGHNQSGNVEPPFPINGVPPFFESLPPGTAILPLPNVTEEYDEEDLSIYYPPPYTFYYEKDNSSAVPPGPLVPGIVLPPPPNFFSIYKNAKTPTKISTTPKAKPYSPTTTPAYRKSNITTMRVRPNKTVSVTILRPVSKPPKAKPTFMHRPHKVSKPFEVYGPPKETETTTKTYDTNLVALYEKEVYPSRTTLKKKRPERPQQYFYYDDSPGTNLVTPYPTKPKIDVRNSSRNYFANMVRSVKTMLTPPHRYLPTPSYQPPSIYHLQPNNFQTHILQLKDHIQNYHVVKNHAINFSHNNKQQLHIPTPKPVYQYSFEVSNYKEQHDRINSPYQEQGRQIHLPKYSVKIEPALEITTKGPIYKSEPIPVYLQSFQNNVPIPRINPEFKYQSQHQDNSYKVTPNPLYQTYYTKQDQRMFDDMTKTYFTTFGKRIPTSTTPLPSLRNNNYKQVSYSQEQTNVPNAEYINYINRQKTQNDPNEYNQEMTKQVPQFVGTYQSPVYEASDNYRQSNIDIQTVGTIDVPLSTKLNKQQDGSFISYELPGDDGAHFYFLTPQLSKYDNQQYDRRRRQNWATKET